MRCRPLLARAAEAHDFLISDCDSGTVVSRFIPGEVFMSADLTRIPWPAVLETVDAGLPAQLGRRGPGRCAAIAAILEATAAKPGNVHPKASFPDLDHADLVAAARAAALPLDRLASGPSSVSLGSGILAAVRSSRAVTRSNANLGIILAIAPLAAASRSPCGPLTPNQVADCLSTLSAGDARDIYEAIRLSGAGGLGHRQEHDLFSDPPADIRDAMRAAATGTPGDQIAGLWTRGYQSLWNGLVNDLRRSLATDWNWSAGVVDAAVRQLAREPDSLIRRRHGDVVAAKVSARAAALLPAPTADPGLLAAFDHSLRWPVRVNPGTTADLVAAALYVVIWSTWYPPAWPAASDL
jgi:triphosphoribosyl-dephospho-CoA synthase